MASRGPGRLQSPHQPGLEETERRLEDLDDAYNLTTSLVITSVPEAVGEGTDRLVLDAGQAAGLLVCRSAVCTEPTAWDVHSRGRLTQSSQNLRQPAAGNFLKNGRSWL